MPLTLQDLPNMLSCSKIIVDDMINNEYHHLSQFINLLMDVHKSTPIVTPYIDHSTKDITIHWGSAHTVDKTKPQSYWLPEKVIKENEPPSQISIEVWGDEVGVGYLIMGFFQDPITKNSTTTLSLGEDEVHPKIAFNAILPYIKNSLF